MMMSFNPSFNPILAAAAAQMPSTPTKPDPSGTPDNDALRSFLAQIGAAAAAAGGAPALPAGLFGGSGAPFGAPGTPGGTATGAAGAPPGAMPFPFLVQGDLKPEMLQQLAAANAAAGGAPGGGPMMPSFMDFAGFHPYGMDGVRRKNATRETTAPLKGWLSDHRKNPYPTKAEKVMLAFVTKMTLTQVSTWFANARRRLKKENKMTWSPRNRPGEDDDDLADLERPGSSKEDDLLFDDHNESNNNENNQSPGVPEDSPRKPKGIWSIADTVGVKADSDEAGSGSSKAASASPTSGGSCSDAAAAAAAGGHAAVLAQMTAAAWQQQQQFIARQMMQLQHMLAAGGPAACGPAGAAAINPLFMAQAMQAAMQARLSSQPGGALAAMNGALAGIPVSSLSPSSSTHSSDAEKPPTLIDATSEDVNDDYLAKKETPETPESA